MKTHFKAFLIGATLLLGLLPKASGMNLAALDSNQGLLLQKIVLKNDDRLDNNFSQYLEKNDALPTLQEKLQEFTDKLESIKIDDKMPASKKLSKTENFLDMLKNVEIEWKLYFQEKKDIKVKFNAGAEQIKKVIKQYTAYRRTLKVKGFLEKAKSYGGKTILWGTSIAATLIILDALLRGRMIGNYHIGTASSCIKNFISENASKFCHWARYTKKELEAMAQKELDRMMSVEKLEQAKTCLKSVDVYKPCQNTIAKCSQEALEFYEKIKPTNGSELNFIPYAPNHEPSALAASVLKETNELQKTHLAIIANLKKMTAKIASHGKFKLDQAKTCLEKATNISANNECIEPITKYAKNFKLSALKMEAHNMLENANLAIEKANMEIEKANWDNANWFRRLFMDNPDKKIVQ